MNLEQLLHALTRGRLGIDGDGGACVFFDKTRNRIGWGSFSWDELDPEQQTQAQQRWDFLGSERQTYFLQGRPAMSEKKLSDYWNRLESQSENLLLRYKFREGDSHVIWTETHRIGNEEQVRGWLKQLHLTLAYQRSLGDHGDPLPYKDFAVDELQPYEGEGRLLDEAVKIHEQELARLQATRTAEQAQQETRERAELQRLLDKYGIPQPATTKSRSLYGVPEINLDDFEIDTAVVQLVPPEVCFRHKLVPVNKAGSSLIVAMVDPSNIFAIDDLKFLTGFNIEVVVTDETAWLRAYERLYKQFVIPNREGHGR